MNCCIVEECLSKKKHKTIEDRLGQRLPILEWSSKYSCNKLQRDILTAVSICLTLIPQSLAYAQLADLPPKYGLFTSFVSAFVYAIFGTCRSVTVGPTSIMAIMTFKYVEVGGIQYAVFLSFSVGIIQIICGFLNLGFLVECISLPVISAFTTAAALTTASSQIKYLFGVNPDKSGDVLDRFVSFIKSFEDIKICDAIMGVASLSVLFVVQFYGKRILNNMKSKGAKTLTFKMINYLMMSKNALVALICSLTAFAFAMTSRNIFTLIPTIPKGFPQIAMPVPEKPLLDIASDFIPGIFIVSLVGIAEVIAIGKSLQSEQINATQEMIALGLANIFGSFFGAFPVTGSFSRSAIASSSKVATQGNGFFVCLFVVLSLTFLAHFFAFIPRATLGAIIISAVIPLIKVDDIVLFWKTSKVDLLPFLVTLVISFVFGLDFGILFGVVLVIIILVFKLSRPNIKLTTEMTTAAIPAKYLFVQFDQSVIFSSIEYFKSCILKSPALRHHRFIVIDGSKILFCDSTVSVGINTLLSKLESNDKIVILFNFNYDVLNSIKSISKDKIIIVEGKQQLSEEIEKFEIKSPMSKCAKSIIDITSRNV